MFPYGLNDSMKGLGNVSGDLHKFERDCRKRGALKKGHAVLVKLS